MDDLQLWNLGTERLKALLSNLSDETGQKLTNLLDFYRKTKETYAAVVAEIDAASLCSECRGQCCLNGKYRVTVVDVLARIASHTPTAADFAQKPVCPYGTGAGCCMEPGLRPADCILFLCDAIDRKLSPLARLTLAEQELLMRKCIQDASRLTGTDSGAPLLLWAAKI